MTRSEQAPVELLERLDEVLMLAGLVQPRGGELDGVGTASDAELFLVELLSLMAAVSPRMAGQAASPLEFAGSRRRRTPLRRLLDSGSCSSLAYLTAVVLQVSLQHQVPEVSRPVAG